LKASSLQRTWLTASRNSWAAMAASDRSHISPAFNLDARARVSRSRDTAGGRGTTTGGGRRTWMTEMRNIPCRRPPLTWTPTSPLPHSERTGRGGSFPGEAVTRIREDRVTTTDGNTATVKVEYQDGTTQIIVADQLRLSSPLEPAAAGVQVANQLNKLNIDLQYVEPDQIVIEWSTG
jgi:hypothetical protein